MTTINRSLNTFKVKDPISALTHFIGFIGAIIGMPVLLIKASAYHCELKTMIGFGVYMLSMIILYGASTSYHSFNINERANRILKKIDHCSIFVLIAGSYTPVCLDVLNNRSGKILLIVIWAIAIAGIIFKIFWVTCPKWVSSVLYIGMGWAALSVIPELYSSMPSDGFLWLLMGGILYTIGGVIYALKPNLFPNEESTGFGNHELFHIFVLMGSLCHFIMMFKDIVLIG
ncbi:MAG: hemolysin III family protein [Erysipelotrichaceae bacterium]|nr:hemolysin III family protein [Erysipelotrichaceae bacterium]